ncbi:MAG TPA: STAS domain-containing protein [Solirubrobacterales bacterium]
MSDGQRQNGVLVSKSEELAEAAGIRPFSLIASVVEDGCREIEIEGELDMAVADRLQQALAACQGDRILISLKACQFIDSTGLAVILNANRASDTRIVLHSPRDQVLRVLDVMGLTSNGVVFADREQALSALMGLAD